MQRFVLWSFLVIHSEGVNAQRLVEKFARCEGCEIRSYFIAAGLKYDQW